MIQMTVLGCTPGNGDAFAFPVQWPIVPQTFSVRFLNLNMQEGGTWQFTSKSLLLHSSSWMPIYCQMLEDRTAAWSPHCSTMQTKVLCSIATWLNIQKGVIMYNQSLEIQWIPNSFIIHWNVYSSPPTPTPTADGDKDSELPPKPWVTVMHTAMHVCVRPIWVHQERQY